MTSPPLSPPRIIRPFPVEGPVRAAKRLLSQLREEFDDHVEQTFLPQLRALLDGVHEKRMQWKETKGRTIKSLRRTMGIVCEDDEFTESAVADVKAITPAYVLIDLHLRLALDPSAMRDPVLQEMIDVDEVRKERGEARLASSPAPSDSSSTTAPGVDPQESGVTPVPLPGPIREETIEEHSSSRKRPRGDSVDEDECGDGDEDASHLRTGPNSEVDDEHREDSHPRRSLRPRKEVCYTYLPIGRRRTDGRGAVRRASARADAK